MALHALPPAVARCWLRCVAAATVTTAAWRTPLTTPAARGPAATMWRQIGAGIAAAARAHATTSQQLPQLNLYGRSFNVPTVRLQPGVPPDALYAGLAARRAVAPLFFKRTPVVLDVEEVPTELDRAALAAYVDTLRRLELIPIGIANATPAQSAAAAELGLPIMIQSGQPATSAPANGANAAAAAAAPPAASGGGSSAATTAGPVIEPVFPAIGDRGRRARGPATARAAAAAAAAAAPAPGLPGATRPAAARTAWSTSPAAVGETMVVRRTVRAGEQVYAAGGHLVVIGSVNPGAEVLADGDIHVYGALRGRALAGLASSAKSRIFATVFDPELIAIASVYTHMESRPAEAANGMAIEALLEGTEIKFRPFSDGRSG